MTLSKQDEDAIRQALVAIDQLHPDNKQCTVGTGSGTYINARPARQAARNEAYIYVNTKVGNLLRKVLRNNETD